MNKRISAFLLSAVLCFSLVCTASASYIIEPGVDIYPSTPSGGTTTTPSGGGSYTPPVVPTYSVSSSANANGTVSLDKTSAKQGDTVTITVTPSSGYQAESITVTDAKGNVITTTSLGDNKHSFVMPDSAVSVVVKFGPVAAANPFVDVARGEYFYDAVLWAVGKGITTGTSATTFSPYDTCTRAQTVTFLWRAAGSPVPQSAANPFTDVSASEYYYNAVLWAVEQGITNGTSATEFSPNATVTRGQTVTFLYRAAKAQAGTGSNPFVDVAESEYYAEAVQWAVNKGITNGTSATTFGPSEGCTRGQIVTFLYRAN